MTHWLWTPPSLAEIRNDVTPCPTHGMFCNRHEAQRHARVPHRGRSAIVTPFVRSSSKALLK